MNYGKIWVYENGEPPTEVKKFKSGKLIIVTYFGKRGLRLLSWINRRRLPITVCAELFAPAHRAALTTEFLDSSHINKVLKQSPHSPDLDPCDFALFPFIKLHLKIEFSFSEASLASISDSFWICVRVLLCFTKLSTLTKDLLQISQRFISSPNPYIKYCLPPLFKISSRTNSRVYSFYSFVTFINRFRGFRRTTFESSFICNGVAQPSEGSRILSLEVLLESPASFKDSQLLDIFRSTSDTFKSFDLRLDLFGVVTWSLTIYSLPFVVMQASMLSSKDSELSDILDSEYVFIKDLDWREILFGVVFCNGAIGAVNAIELMSDVPCTLSDIEEATSGVSKTGESFACSLMESVAKLGDIKAFAFRAFLFGNLTCNSSVVEDSGFGSVTVASGRSDASDRLMFTGFFIGHIREGISSDFFLVVRSRAVSSIPNGMLVLNVGIFKIHSVLWGIGSSKTFVEVLEENTRITLGSIGLGSIGLGSVCCCSLLVNIAIQSFRPLAGFQLLDLALGDVRGVTFDLVVVSIDIGFISSAGTVASSTGISGIVLGVSRVTFGLSKFNSPLACRFFSLSDCSLNIVSGIGGFSLDSLKLIATDLLPSVFLPLGFLSASLPKEFSVSSFPLFCFLTGKNDLILSLLESIFFTVVATCLDSFEELLGEERSCSVNEKTLLRISFNTSLTSKKPSGLIRLSGFKEFSLSKAAFLLASSYRILKLLLVFEKLPIDMVKEIFFNIALDPIEESFIENIVERTVSLVCVATLSPSTDAASLALDALPVASPSSAECRPSTPSPPPPPATAHSPPSRAPLFTIAANQLDSAYVWFEVSFGPKNQKSESSLIQHQRPNNN
nr:unnamed protein product [Callosobruchus chinensis]